MALAVAMVVTVAMSVIAIPNFKAKPHLDDPVRTRIALASMRVGSRGPTAVDRDEMATEDDAMSFGKQDRFVIVVSGKGARLF